MAAMTNGIGWFEIGTDDVATTERFYGELFGWNFSDDDDGSPYRVVDTGVPGSIGGGVFATGGAAPNYAVFYVEVADVAQVSAQVEKAGGKVVTPVKTTPTGLVFAHVTDPGGNHFAVYSPPPAAG